MSTGLHVLASRGRPCSAIAFSAVCALAWAASAPAWAQQRVLGLDVSAWQGNISQTTWNNIHNVEKRDFVFIRSSRGGTTGEDHRQGGFPTNDNTFFNLSQRYDDRYFVQNINRATTAGMFAGSYHFARPDVIASTPNSGGIPNHGTDEANHFMQMAGAWMRPGYLLPVYDFEAGDGDRTDDELAQFSLDFSDRVYEVMGIRPAIYTNGNYASFVIGEASSSLQDQVVAAFPTLWSARWPNQANPDAIDVQNGHPKDSFAPIYGPWDDAGVTHPWAFWQYASTGRLQSFNNGNSNLDLNVAQGGIEFLKDNLVPAIWMNDSSGDWSTLSNWNSGQAPIAPVLAPGQLTPVGTQTLPTPRLPGAAGSGVTAGLNDTVILDRPNADIEVTISTGTHNIRKLYVRESLEITGGSLTVNYVPSPDSTPLAAQFSAPVAISSNGSLSVHTLQVDSEQTFTLGGGGLTFQTIQLMPHSTTPAKILMTGNVSFSPLANAAAVIANGAGAGAAGFVDLDGGERTFQIGNGSAETDLTVSVPLTNGALKKSGVGTLALTGANSYAGDTTVEAGTLSISSAFLSDVADVYLAAGAVLSLDFNGGPDMIDALFIDGVSQAVGIWGALDSGAQFVSPLISGTGLLQVTTFVPLPLPGDYNEDGVVNATDFVRWRDNLGSDQSLPNDDTPGVGLDDFDRWRVNFGNTNLIGASSAMGIAVPEPGAAVLLVIGSGVLAVFCGWDLRKSTKDDDL